MVSSDQRCTFDKSWEQVVNTTIPVDPGTRVQMVDAFELRLRALGVRSTEFLNGYQVLQRLPLTPRTLSVAEIPESAGSVDPAVSTPGRQLLNADSEENDVRRWLNRHLRRMLTVEERGGRKDTMSDPPPYVRVYVVGDLGETAVRVASASLLRWLQAEVLRAVRPIFQSRFYGLTRPVAVVPILSMPHPADSLDTLAWQGLDESEPDGVDQAHTERTRLPPDVLRQRVVQERVMLMAVHRIRRSLEVVPPQERLVFELFVNSRVTDRAVLDRETSISETVSFLWLCLRNIVPELDTLNSMVRNVNSDVLATFSCRELNYNAGLVATWMTLGHARLMLREFVGLRAAGDFAPNNEREQIPEPVTISAPPRIFEHVRHASPETLTPTEKPAWDAQKKLLEAFTGAADDVRKQCGDLINLVSREQQPMDLLQEGLSERWSTDTSEADGNNGRASPG